jgi:hypothetical protein
MRSNNDWSVLVDFSLTWTELGGTKRRNSWFKLIAFRIRTVDYGRGPGWGDNGFALCEVRSPPHSPAWSLLQRTKHVTETLHFLLKFFTKGRFAALQGTRRGKRFPCSFSSLLLSFALTASLATPTQRRRFPSRRLARAYFCGLFSYCCYT